MALAIGVPRMTLQHDPERPQRPARQPDGIRELDHATAELHDQVVQAIFAVGLDLHGTTEIAADPLVRRRIERALSDLDDLVRTIRGTVFHLGHHPNDRGSRPEIAPPRPW